MALFFLVAWAISSMLQKYIIFPPSFLYSYLHFILLMPKGGRSSLLKHLCFVWIHPLESVSILDTYISIVTSLCSAKHVVINGYAFSSRFVYCWTSEDIMLLLFSFKNCRLSLFCSSFVLSLIFYFVSIISISCFIYIHLTCLVHNFAYILHTVITVCW